MKIGILFLLLAIGFDAEGAPAAAESSRVADVMLAVPDLAGKGCRPLRGGVRQPAVLFFVTHDCPISNGYAPEYQRLWREYSAKGLPMYLVYVDPDAKPGALTKHREDFKLTQYPAIHDREHRLVAATGATMTPEVVVVGDRGQIEYRGRVDNLHADYGKRRRAPTVRDLRDALDALVAGKPVKKPRTEAIGCFIPPLPEK